MPPSCAAPGSSHFLPANNRTACSLWFCEDSQTAGASCTITPPAQNDELLPAIHGIVCESVGLAVLLPEHVPDIKPVQLRDELLGAPVKINQRRIFHLILPAQLPHQQLRVADHLESFVPVIHRVLQRGQQS